MITEEAYIQDPEVRRAQLTDFVREQQGEAEEFIKDPTPEETFREKVIKLLNDIYKTDSEILLELRGDAT